MNKEHPGERASRELPLLALAALGIVFGDIGTSPLYAFRECFLGPYGLDLSHENVLGVLSLMLWSLILVIGVKYATFMLRADNQGEGGILALVALITADQNGHKNGKRIFITLGLIGAVFLYADAMITPAISVLSAVEGLEVIAPELEPYVIPLTLVLLTLLYLFQYRGTASIGMIFGPIIVVWFATLGILGVISIIQMPEVLAAVHPKFAINFFLDNGFTGFVILGVIFLVVTGGEALYADMGHLGRGPIRLAWFTVVLPGLLLNYFGQGAFILRAPDSIENIFFLLAPTWGLIPLVILATMATIIASQAVISGAFSLTSQAIQLGYCPRFNIIQTSPQIIGQIYIPFVNWMFLIAAIALVLMFQESGRLVAAYGLAVSATMFITTLFLYTVARHIWKWRRRNAVLLALPFVFIDLNFLLANTMKIPQGGWFPLIVAAVIYLLMSTWEQGLRHLRTRLTDMTCSCELFLTDIKTTRPHRVPGVAVFLTRQTSGIPRTLLHNFKHNRILHETNIFLTIETKRIPKVRSENRATVESYGSGLHRVIMQFGFLEHPNVPTTLQRIALKQLDIELEPMDTTYFLGRETLIVQKTGGMPMHVWRRRLFALMLNNAFHAARYFRIPVNRVVEFGAQLEI